MVLKTGLHTQEELFQAQNGWGAKSQTTGRGVIIKNDSAVSCVKDQNHERFINFLDTYTDYIHENKLHICML